jgi:ATP-dependent helicase/nuclease subunit B
LLKKIEADLRSHGARIFSGDVAARPYRKGNERACDWCQCQPVCRFDSWIHPFNVLRKPPEENGEKGGE